MYLRYGIILILVRSPNSYITQQMVIIILFNKNLISLIKKLVFCGENSKNKITIFVGKLIIFITMPEHKRGFHTHPESAM